MAIRDTIRDVADTLTASERKIADAILADYPFGGLHPIQDLADKVGVSAPSITRFVSKIGLAGYQDLQRQLVGELREGSRSPLDLKATETPGESGAFLADYARRASHLVGALKDFVPQEQFDRIVAMIADPARDIYLLGGRISNTVAALLGLHLQQIRPRVQMLPPNPEHWPDHVLRMRKQDVFLLFDFRRYQPDLERLAGIVAAQRRVTMIAVTDKWMSPVARHSDHVIALPIENETAWDSALCVVAFVEALIISVSEADWPATRKRIEAWDALRLAPPGQERRDAT
jgi:DNA-binding MurR/RpiR family transcriptional regulator